MAMEFQIDCIPNNLTQKEGKKIILKIHVIMDAEWWKKVAEEKSPQLNDESRVSLFAFFFPSFRLSSLWMAQDTSGSNNTSKKCKTAQTQTIATAAARITLAIGINQRLPCDNITLICKNSKQQP